MKLNKWLSILVVNCSLLIGFTACDDDDNDSNELSLSAPILTEIAAPTAIATSDVIVSQQDLDEGTIRVMAYGFCYNTSKNPTIYSATVKTLPENGKMEATCFRNSLPQRSSVLARGGSYDRDNCTGTRTGNAC